MVEVYLLGTGGVMPLMNRYLTSCFIRVNNKGLLIDSGEGTQIAFQNTPYSFNNIDIICITHNHPDHFNGLSGILMAMAYGNRKEAITIIAPEIMHQTLSILLQITPRLPFPIYFSGLKKEQENIDLSPIQLTAFKVDHNTICYGYSIEVKRNPSFDAKKAKEYGIPKEYWSILQKGEVVKYNGKKYKPEVFIGEERKGLKITYCTDTRPCGNIEINARGADLLLLEGMYGDLEKQEDAINKKHMTMEEACIIAKKAKVKECWLTHYSPSMKNPEQYINQYQSIFPAKLGKDGMHSTLVFEK